MRASVLPRAPQVMHASTDPHQQGHSRPGTLPYHHNGVLPRRHGTYLYILTIGTNLTCVCVQGILLVYDVTNEKSFENIKTWIRNIEQHASDDVEKMILGNKCDMDDKRVVTKEQGQKVRRAHALNCSNG